jgi:hypothetical protein
MKQPENQSKKYATLFSDIDTGRIKIPQFQRDFVWDKGQTAKLIDSIIKGYPIGTFIFWKTRERLRHLKDVGNHKLPEPPEGDAILYVLDGQQRITSLYAVRKGIRINREGVEIDYRDIFINLAEELDTEEEVVVTKPSQNGLTISVHHLLEGDITDFDDYDKELRKKIAYYRERLTGYDFSVIEISDYPIDVACEIFTRINTGGKELTLFEIMVAKTYDQENDFDLSERYEDLIDNDGADEKDLEDAGFETIPPVTILQCISAILTRGIKRKNILTLERKSVVNNWPEVRQGIFTAIDHLQSHLGVAVSRILPYSALLVPFTYFFQRNKFRPADHNQSNELLRYFYWTSLSNRFSSAVETKMETDFGRMDQILQHKPVTYNTSERMIITEERLAGQQFSANDAFCKAVICYLASLAPLSLVNNSKIKLSNNWLNKSSSRNFHHIFPKAFLKKQKIPSWEANGLVNIMLVDDYVNKRVIKASRPSEYFLKFAKKNPGLAEALNSHCISDLQDFGILDDDFLKFTKKRSALLAKSLASLLP